MLREDAKRERYSFPLSYKDIVRLARFLQSAFNHFGKYKSSFEERYLSSIKVITDCYILILAERGSLSINDERLNIFRSYRNLKGYPGDLESLSLAIGEMTNFVADKSEFVDNFWFYKDFVASVKNILGSRASYCLYQDEKEVQRLQKILLGGKK